MLSPHLLVLRECVRVHEDDRQAVDARVQHRLQRQTFQIFKVKDFESVEFHVCQV